MPTTSASTGPDSPKTALSPEEQAVLQRMRAMNPKADPLARVPGVPPSRIPRHIAIIMDGNGRWANERGLPRRAGHKAGALAVRATVEECGRLGVEALTLYSFSLENWKRPREEIEGLMALYLEYMRAEREHLVKHNMRFRQIGRREGLPEAALAELDLTIEATRRCTGPTLCLAVNYGSRAEITDAVRSLARRVERGELKPEDIDESALSNSLDTAGLPDPDLLIRTAGEMRVSNYLLWQISYSELHVTPTLWPDFRAEHLQAAVRDFASRRRRFGGLDADQPDQAPAPAPR